MKIKFLIQSSFIKTEEVYKQFDALNQLSTEIIDFGVIPFTNILTNLENILEEDYHYVVLGSIKSLTSILSAKHISELNEYLTKDQLDLSDHYLKRLKSGLFYDLKSFDQAYYNTLNLPLFNKDCIIENFEKAKNLKFDEIMFVKPTSDLKAFNGGFVSVGETFEEFINRNQLMSNVDYSNVNVLFSHLKESEAEYRFFVVNKEVVSGSRYMLDRVVKPSKEVPKEIFDKAIEYAKLYQPADIFTMDLVKNKSGIYIMEYNCFNCSGTYENDLVKTYGKIIDYIKEKDLIPKKSIIKKQKIRN